MCNLVFFCFISFHSCKIQSSNEGVEVEVIYESGKAAAVKIHSKLLEDRDASDDLKIELENNESNTNVLGEFYWNENILFKPLIPLTPGKTYLIMAGGEAIAKFTIPESDNSSVPVITEIFPGQDTVPSNLLKMYLQFSEPMGVDHSGKFVKVLDAKGDSVNPIFLNLVPELWNEDKTILTLWLDPGRIKRGLIPNERLGAPLIEERYYTLIIMPGWRSKKGTGTGEEFNKKFFVSHRDSISPSTDSWTLLLPLAESNDRLVIHFNETLDYILCQEAISIWKDTVRISGKATLTNEEQQFNFYPDSPWKEGDYKVEAESRLEDLAGNNLNRLFETDKTQAPPVHSAGSRYLHFIISDHK